MPKQTFDVVVVGAGMIGAAAACLFARQGLTVGLVETRSLGQCAEADGRVSAINPAVRNLFEALEIWPGDDSQQVSAYHAMKVWDCNSPAKISFLAADLGVPSLGYIVENRVPVAAMLAKLRHNYGVTIMDNTEVTAIERTGAGGGLRVGLSAGPVETQLLVGADGAHSRVRQLGGLSTRFFDFAQDAIVTTLTTSGAHHATARQCFLETGPVAMLPLADGRSSLVWSCDREWADEIMALDDARFRARLEPLFADELGEITACLPRRRFTLAQHHAESYIADSLALVGDAAHLTHPLAGLGANIGFMDAAALAEVVEQAHKRGGNIGGYAVLRRYERWRRGDNQVVLAVMRGFKELFGSRLAAAKAVRGAGMNLVDSLTPLKTMLANFATGRYGDIPALCRRGHV